MKRHITNLLLAWKQKERRKPLLIRGARQVGKTYIINEFGGNSFDNFARFDFIESLSLHKIFSGDINPELLLQQLELHARQKIVPGRTLVFFDEIQRCPRALASLKYFHEKMPHMHIIAAGSLLEFAMEDESFPVGSVEFAWMRPLNFSEFLDATGEGMLRDHLPDRYAMAPVPPAIHDMLIQRLKLYFAIGGMPEAVQEYVTSRSLTAIESIHKNIIQSYISDINKYRGRLDLPHIDSLLERLPSFVGKHVKYAELEPDWTQQKTRQVLQLLERILLVQKVRAARASGLPLGADASSKAFKLLFLDIGLMQHVCGMRAADILVSPEVMPLYHGALAEQFVGQELLCENASENGSLYYWQRDSKNARAEVDYLLVRDGLIYPLEVKSGAPHHLKSITIFLAGHPHTPHGYVLSTANVRHEPAYKLTFLPLYSRMM